LGSGNGVLAKRQGSRDWLRGMKVAFLQRLSSGANRDRTGDLLLAKRRLPSEGADLQVIRAAGGARQFAEMPADYRRLSAFQALSAKSA
jgi:hypothetical protein